MYTEDLLYEAVIYQTTCQESSGVDMMTRSEAGPVVAPQGGSSIPRGFSSIVLREQSKEGSNDSVGLAKSGTYAPRGKTSEKVSLIRIVSTKGDMKSCKTSSDAPNESENLN
jgi:hypothetical protein